MIKGIATSITNLPFIEAKNNILFKEEENILNYIKKFDPNTNGNLLKFHSNKYKDVNLFSREFLFRKNDDTYRVIYNPNNDIVIEQNVNHFKRGRHYIQNNSCVLDRIKKQQTLNNYFTINQILNRNTIGNIELLDEDLSMIFKHKNTKEEMEFETNIKDLVIESIERCKKYNQIGHSKIRDSFHKENAGKLPNIDNTVSINQYNSILKYNNNGIKMMMFPLNIKQNPSFYKEYKIASQTKNTYKRHEDEMSMFIDLNHHHEIAIKKKYGYGHWGNSNYGILIPGMKFYQNMFLPAFKTGDIIKVVQYPKFDLLIEDNQYNMCVDHTYEQIALNNTSLFDTLIYSFNEYLVPILNISKGNPSEELKTWSSIHSLSEDKLIKFIINGELEINMIKIIGNSNILFDYDKSKNKIEKKFLQREHAEFSRINKIVNEFEDILNIQF